MWRFCRGVMKGCYHGDEGLLPSGVKEYSSYSRKTVVE